MATVPDISYGKTAAIVLLVSLVTNVPVNLHDLLKTALLAAVGTTVSILLTALLKWLGSKF